jgi:hypothetical protein
MGGTIDDPTNWLPAAGASSTITGGHWKLKAQGKNRRNGCFGEDDSGTGSDDLSYRITVTRL